MLDYFLDHLNELVKKLFDLQLSTFSPQQLKQFYNQIAILNNETVKSYELDKQTAQQKARLSQLSNGATNNRQVFDLSKTLLQAAFVKKAQAWRIKQSVTLAKNDIWQRFAVNAPKRLLEIQELQASWKLHGEYATFSTPDLIGVYWINMGAIHRWLIAAQKEFFGKKAKLSQELFEQCQSDFITLLAELERAKQAMRASLLARLEIGVGCGDLGFDDVIANTTQTLMKLGAMPSMTLPNGNYRQMTPSTLHYIRQIISSDGNDTEKGKLAAILNDLFGQRTPDRLMAPLVGRTNAAGILFFIPTTVQKIIPNKPPLYTRFPKVLQFLFHDQKTVYEFFQSEDCQYLLLAQRHLKKLSSDGLTLDNLRHHATWNYWGELMAIYARETQRCHVALQTFSGFFQANERQVLKCYQTVLASFAQQLFNQQLVFFKRCLDILEAANQTRTISQAEIFALEKVMLRLSQLQRESHVSIKSDEWENVLARYHMFFGVLAQVKIAAPLYKKSTEILQKISSGQRLISAEQELLNDVNIVVSTTVLPSSKDSTQAPTLDLDGIPINPLYERGLFTINRRVTRQDVWHLFQQALMQSPLTLSSEKLIAHIEKLKQQMALLTMLNPELLSSSALQTEWYRYTHRLLVAIQQLPKHSDFIRQENDIELILRTLLSLVKDDVLHREIMQLKQSMSSLKSLDWELFVQIAITPRIAALEKTLSPESTNKTLNQIFTK